MMRPASYAGSSASFASGWPRPGPLSGRLQYDYWLLWLVDCGIASALSALRGVNSVVLVQRASILGKVELGEGRGTPAA